MALELFDAYLTLYKDKWWFGVILVLLTLVSVLGTVALLRRWVAEKYVFVATVLVYVLGILPITYGLTQVAFMGTGIWGFVALMLAPPATAGALYLLGK